MSTLRTGQDDLSYFWQVQFNFVQPFSDGLFGKKDAQLADISANVEAAWFFFATKGSHVNGSFHSAKLILRFALL